MEWSDGGNATVSSVQFEHSVIVHDATDESSHPSSFEVTDQREVAWWRVEGYLTRTVSLIHAANAPAQDAPGRAWPRGERA